MVSEISSSVNKKESGSVKTTRTSAGHLFQGFSSALAVLGGAFIGGGSNKETLAPEGVEIVLTASYLEMSDFNLNPFLAFTGGFPQLLMQKKYYPSLPFNPDGSAKFAPYGLRKVESLLIDEFGAENVVVTHPDNLSRFVGPKTKIVGITTMDPLGTGFVSRTYTSILGLNGKPATLAEFEDLVYNPTLQKSNAKVLVGGSGAWQISEAKMQETMGIDTVLIGQAEHSIIEIMRRALGGEQLDKVMTMAAPSHEEIPAIKNASIYGTVEIMRGCGRGCSFCSPTVRQRYSIPLDRIVKEVELNASAGTRMILLQTDDLFLYQAKSNFIPNKEAIVELIRAVNEIEGIEFLQAAHASLAPVVYDKTIVEEIAPALVEKSSWICRGTKCASMEVGVETGSARLMKQYMHGKMLPYRPEQWQDVVVRSVEIMNDHDVYPLATLILGLPGETEADVRATSDLLDRLEGSKIYYVPLLFTSEEETKLCRKKHSTLKDLDDSQWEIMSRCWKHNLDTWNPEWSRTIALASILSYPFFRLKHGRRYFAPFMKISGLEDKLMGRKAGLKCQTEYCIPSLDPTVKEEVEDWGESSRPGHPGA